MQVQQSNKPNVNFGYNEFGHNLFDIEFPKHKQWFESIHNQQPLKNVNTTSSMFLTIFEIAQ